MILLEYESAILRNLLERSLDPNEEVSSDYILTGNTETSDVLGVTARLSKLPAEHIKNVENILDRYMEGIAISRQIQMHDEKNG